MERHTPDAWEVTEESRGRAYSLMAQEGSKRMVLEMPAGLGRDEFKANAVLMAAAPAMYDALSELYDAASLYFSHEDVDVETRVAALEHAREALDLAIGAYKQA